MSQKFIGLIPAAGFAKRLAPLPCSKEIIPVGFVTNECGQQRVQVVCEHLIEEMLFADIDQIFMVLRQGKWDVPQFLSAIDLAYIAYIVVPATPSVPHTIDNAFPFIKSNIVAFGFPDIIFESNNAFRRLFNHLESTGCDVVLGLFPAPFPEKADTVAVISDKVMDIQIKAHDSSFTQSWGIAVWTPKFTEFLHHFLKKNLVDDQHEIHLSNIILAAISEGLQIQAIPVSSTPFLDIGTPAGLRTAQALTLEN